MKVPSLMISEALWVACAELHLLCEILVTLTCLLKLPGHWVPLPSVAVSVRLLCAFYSPALANKWPGERFAGDRKAVLAFIPYLVVGCLFLSWEFSRGSSLHAALPLRGGTAAV
jgi:hypothetical protein